jgi:hypothetical protein
VWRRLDALPSDFPDLALLGYCQTRPHLRVLHVPEGIVEPSPVPLNGAASALDDAIVREGWVAILPAAEQWAVRLPLQGRAERFGRFWDCVPALHPRRVWRAGTVRPEDWREDRQESTLVEGYDGLAGRVVRALSLPPGSRLEAEVPDGLVFRGEDGLYLWDIERSQARGLVSTVDLLAAHDSTLAVLFPKQLVLVDTASGRQRRVRKSLAGEWQRFGASFSPNGPGWRLPSERSRPPTFWRRRLPAVISRGGQGWR